MLSLYETGDPAKLAPLVENKRLNPLYKQFLSELHAACNENGGLKVSYSYGSGRKGGRLYADRGYQNAPKALRRLCLEEWHWAFDIKNSVPYFIWFLVRELPRARELLGYKVSALQEYVERREEVLGRVQEELGVDREGAKNAMLKITHGGSKFDDSSCAGDYPTTRAYQAAVRAAAEILGKWYYKKLWKDCEKKGDAEETLPGRSATLYDKLGRFVHYLATRYEAATMRAAMQYFWDKGCDICCLVHDEVIVSDRTGKLPADKGEVVSELNAYIRENAVYPGVETSKPGTKFMNVAGKRVEVCVPVPPTDIGWSVQQMIAQPGDLERVLLPLGSPGCTNIPTYVTVADMAKTASGRPVLHPLSFEKHSVQCLNAWTGMGKTYTAFEFIYRLRREKPGARILWVTGRRTQATSGGGGLRLQCHAWKAAEMKRLCEEKLAQQQAADNNSVVLQGIIDDIVVYYEKDEGTGSYCDLYNAKIVFCQEESLWKLQSQERGEGGLPFIQQYSLCVLDEFILICDQTVSEKTNRGNLRTNNVVLMDVCERAERLLIMDKDLAECSRLYDFLFCSKEEGIAFRRAKCDTIEQAQAQVEFHNYLYILPSLERRLKIVRDYDTWKTILADSLADNSQRSWTCFRSQRALEATYDDMVRLGHTFPHLVGSPDAREAYDKLMNEGKVPRHHTPELDAKALCRQNRPEGPMAGWTEEQKARYAHDNKTRSEWAEGARVRIIDGRTAERTKQRMLANIDSWLCYGLSDCKCVDRQDERHCEGRETRGIFSTSAAMVAVDAQTPFQLVMLNCADRERKVAVTGPTGRGLAQMLMRVRNLAAPATILAYFGDGGLGPVRSYDEALARSGKAWQHCQLFKTMLKNFTQKQNDMIRQAARKGKISDWALVDGARRVGGFTDSSGRVHYYEVPTSLQLRLIAREVEHQRDLGYGCWRKLSTDFIVTLDEARPLEERLLKLASARAEKGGWHEKEKDNNGGGEQKGEEKKKTKKVRTKDDVLLRLVLTQLIDWESSAVEHDVLWRKDQMEHFRGIHSLEEKQKQVVGVLARYPGFYSYAARLNTVELVQDFQRLESALPKLDSRVAARGAIKISGPQQILATKENAAKLYDVAKTVSEALGKSNFIELDASACAKKPEECDHEEGAHTEISNQLLHEKDAVWRRACNDLFYAQAGVRPKDLVAQAKEQTTTLGRLQHVVNRFGLYLAKDGDKSTMVTEKGGSKKRKYAFVLRKMASGKQNGHVAVCFAERFHDGQYRDPRPLKKQKVTHDTDV